MLNPNTKKFWNDKNIEQYISLISSPIYLYKSKFIYKLIPKIKMRLLNIGVGNGFLEVKLSQNKKQIELYGIDISDKSINNIKKKVTGKFVTANVNKLPFKDSYFETIVCSDILEHLTHSEMNAAFKEITRVLKQNGLLIISVPLNESQKDRQANKHLQNFNESNFIKTFENFGFLAIKIKYIAAFMNLFFIKNFINLILKTRENNLAIGLFKVKQYEGSVFKQI